MEMISIIVPVYNVEKYLIRCLESLLNQTFTNIEILLVDDGSKDSSGKICDEFSKKDDRIKVFHKVNGGLSDARNYGLDRASGDYICFIDSDDYIADDYCMIMYNTAREKDADIVICKYDRFEGDSYKGELVRNAECSVYSKSEAMERLYSFDGEIMTLAWNKLYKRKVIADTRYPVGLINEDEFTTYKFLLNADRIAVLSDILYFYFKNNNSITTNKNYLENMDIFKALEERKRILLSRGDMTDVIGLHDKTYLNRLIFRNRELRNINKDKYKKLLGIYRDYYKDARSGVRGVGYLIYYFCPSLYYSLVEKRN